ncbi:hypothetical protein ASE75_14135 [Sphingomonas sp. Leaf17]|uniref:type II toxin-antitoxin system RelE/ParE family toxin n=1 Tax=Sphingomonas sp. Leaf17 TaxID=1735683 RepID=UPI0006F1E3FB|nr:type II toxin-antitoxin system RelE/ParE family toxin [Sphingomonas sp. Leaf17]KQM62752.1 hypothetical protein ASE75_14135 [Sphingomonas sp. Leaf17]
MNRVLWSQSATDDLAAIRDYLSDIDPALAQGVLQTIIRSTGLIQDYPAMGTPLSYRSWRKWRVRGTPYILIYESTPPGIAIARVRHEREDWFLLP